MQQQQQNTSKKKNWVKWLGIGCLATIVLTGGMLYLLSKAAQTTMEVIETGVGDKSAVEVIQHSAKNDGVAQYVYVDLKNVSDKLISYVDVQVVYRDAEGKTVGTGIGNAANFAAGETITVQCMAMGVQNAASYTVRVQNVMY